MLMAVVCMPRPKSRPAALSAAAVLDALATVSTVTSPVILGPGALTFGLMSLAGQSTLCVRFNYEEQQGSIGVMEAAQLVNAVQRARSERLVLVFLFETSGIRVTDGTNGIASLRAILRAAEDARLDGVRMLAAVLKSAFGGASMLAALCELRLVHSGSLYSMSGPRLIGQTVGTERLDAFNSDDVLALLGGTARAATSSGFHLVDPTPEAYRDAILNWMAASSPSPVKIGSLKQEATVLETRLLSHALDPGSSAELHAPSLRKALDELFPRGYTTHFVDGVGIASSDLQPSVRAFFLSAQEGVGAHLALTLAKQLLHTPPIAQGASHNTHVLVDSPGHAATPEDERVVLSEYLAHLAMCMRALQRQGEQVEVIVTGVGGGGIQGALGSGAAVVSMAEGARLVVLPPAALRALNKAQGDDEGSLSEALHAGAVDLPFSPSRYAIGAKT